MSCSPPPIFLLLFLSFLSSRPEVGTFVAWMESLVEEHHQAMSGQSLEDVIAGSKSQSDQRKLMRPQPEQALKCPRCESTNTKFCYYNNYSLSQPRYFCKGCRRYWTQGGSLRNVPVGGGCRKNRRSSSSSSKKSQDAHNAALPITTCNGQLIPHLPSLAYDPSDLTLAFARLQRQPTMGLDDHHPLSLLRNNPITTHSSTTDVVGEHHHHGPTFATSGLFDALRTGFFDDPNGFHGVCSGFSHNSTASEGGSAFPFGEMSSTGVPPLTTAATTTTTSSTITTATKQHQQGPYNNRSFRDGDHHQMEMWGMNWQFNGEGSMASDNPERDYWHGNGSAWHGIINSPLV